MESFITCSSGILEDLEVSRVPVYYYKLVTNSVVHCWLIMLLPEVLDDFVYVEMSNLEWVLRQRSDVYGKLEF